MRCLFAQTDALAPRYSLRQNEQHIKKPDQETKSSAKNGKHGTAKNGTAKLKPAAKNAHQLKGGCGKSKLTKKSYSLTKMCIVSKQKAPAVPKLSRGKTSQGGNDNAKDQEGQDDSDDEDDAADGDEAGSHTREIHKHAPSGGCNCKRSMCLKLYAAAPCSVRTHILSRLVRYCDRYCECFGAQALCTDMCNCVTCENTKDTPQLEAHREKYADKFNGPKFCTCEKSSCEK